METSVYENEDGITLLSVDAYNRLSRKGFCDLVAKHEGVTNLKRSILPKSEFCKFEFAGSNFTIEEDGYDYWYNLKPDKENSDAIRCLESYFSNQDIPEYSTRPIYLFLVFMLVALVIYTDLQCG